MNFSSLPVDLIIEIATKLEKADAYNMCRVAKKMWKISHNKKFWNKFLPNHVTNKYNVENWTDYQRLL